MQLPSTHCPCRVSVYDKTLRDDHWSRRHDALCGCHDADMSPRGTWYVPRSYVRDAAHVIIGAAPYPLYAHDRRREWVEIELL